MNIIGKKNWYFLISALVIIPGLVSIFLFGLKFSIDFTGGSLLEVKIESPKEKITEEKLQSIVSKQNIEASSVQSSGDKTYLFRLKTITKDQSNAIQKKIAGETKAKVTEARFETVGPTIGKELTQKAILSVIIVSLAIVVYIAWAFRQVPKPTSSWQFGITAVVALLHDVLIVIGLFSIFGHLYGAEVDSLFITALLTVMGFSVHDTIVVFDRIRENLRRMSGAPFATVVNESILQTLGRSLSTSMTVLFTLFALLLFSTGSIRWFIVALFTGVISGTYSSIFNAAPLLVVWHEWRNKK